MRQQDRERARRLVAHVRSGRLRGCAPEIQEQVDAALDWLAEQVSGSLIVPKDVLWDLRDMLDWDEDRQRSLEPETVAAASVLVLWADQDEQERVAAEEEGGEYTDGARARKLDPEESGTAGRFTALGISQGAAAYAENPAGNGDTGRAPAPRWRTREKRCPSPPIGSPEKTRLMLRQATGSEIGELRALLGRGRPSAAVRQRRDELAVAVAQLRGQRVMAAALAEALDCDCATEWRLHQRGSKLIARSTDAMGEGSGGLADAA